MADYFNSALTEAVYCRTPQEATEKFVKLLGYIEVKNSVHILADIRTITSEIFQETVPVISTKKFCNELIKFLSDRKLEDDMAIRAFHNILERMQSRNIAFEAQIVDLRDQLSQRLEAIGRNMEAATVLSEMPLESGQRTYPNSFKMNIYLRIAEFHLQSGNITDAEAYVNRSSLLQSDCEDQNLLLRHKTAHARLLDHKQRFLEVGQRFAELSIRFPGMEEAMKLKFLEHALAAALLAGAGQQRTRLLTTLYKDERCQTFEAYNVLKNMYMGRLITRDAQRSLEPLFEKFYPHLLGSGRSGVPRTHQQQNDSSVLKILERAMVEHNMVAASLIYNNIRLDRLGSLLGISKSEAEAVASQMISEGRLTGQMDQIDEIVHFKVPVSGHDPVLSAWSSQIHSLCDTVNRITEDITTAHPDWVQKQLAT